MKKCPLFYELEDVFGHKEPTIVNTIIDTGDTIVLDNVLFEDIASSESYIQLEREDEAIESNENTSASSTGTTEASDQPLSAEESGNNTPASRTGRKGIYSRTALSEILQVQTQLIEMKKARIDIDVKLKENELGLEKEKFLFHKQTRIEELKLKEMEIMSNEKVKLSEIQMKEKVALKELEMKERIELEKLKHIN